MDGGKKIVFNNWLSAIIQMDCFDIIVDDEFIKRSNQKGTDEYKWNNSLHYDSKPLFLQTKVSTQTINHIKFLESIGFFLIDTNLTLKKEIDPQQHKNTAYPSTEMNIRFADSKDREAAVALGGGAFLYSRFHLDPWFSNSLANRIKAQWVAGYFDGNRGDQMVIALFDNKIVGFLQILKPEKNFIIIDLIGVDNNYQRKGIAKRMINFAIQRNSSINHIIVGTQIGNIPSIKLYQKMGFIVDNAKYVFHLHKE